MSTIVKESARYRQNCTAALPESCDLRSHGLQVLPDSCMTPYFIGKTGLKLVALKKGYFLSPFTDKQKLDRNATRVAFPLSVHKITVAYLTMY
jgi:hypothetical protein